MKGGISESDWKLFRKLHEIALERFCEGVLAELGRLVSDTDKSAHGRYLEMYELVMRRDKELAEAFDDMRRSTAWIQLAVIHSRGLLTEDEFAGFSPETRESLRIFSGA